MQREDNQFLMFTHLSQLAHFVFPFGGLLVPIVLWQIKKDEILNLESHAKEIINFQISFSIYAIVAGILIILLIGLGFLLIIGLITVIVPVIGAVKAANGEFFKYPLTIQFLK
ncbi:DUF4870 domain-containing protein [Solitalea sp. MAHUQ-68]|uniref:DUF4870 domain-containing protein n=1 Tax=Solitalea agri TaxID=2953739 RepID=A0A9X2F8M4_9SPHI|nr:DUF4870 domain-containing protein [Solitalea agri]MCO4292558.1 DUF4870 domain-containing protein [Solitalea agri]